MKTPEEIKAKYNQIKSRTWISPTTKEVLAWCVGKATDEDLEFTFGDA